MLPLDKDPKSLVLTMIELAYITASFFGQKIKLLLKKVTNYSTKDKLLIIYTKIF